MEDYRMVRCVGSGSFGKAWLCERRKNGGGKCIIKQVEMRKMALADRQLARKEAALLATMRHPNIIAYLDSFFTGPSDLTLCIVMEWADGGDLYSYLKSCATGGGRLASARVPRYLAESQIIDWLVQLSLALKHIHDRKVLHRDIKSQNVFLTSTHTVKLGDFGIAKVLSSTLEQAATSIGTPYYMSPEIMREKRYNHKSDMWSLGCVVYEMVALRRAFDGSDMRQLALKITRGSPLPLSQHYSPDLRALVMSLLSKSPKDRPGSNSVLSAPLVKRRISAFLDEAQLKDEFSHTVLHGEVLNAADFAPPPPARAPAVRAPPKAGPRREPPWAKAQNAAQDRVAARLQEQKERERALKVERARRNKAMAAAAAGAAARAAAAARVSAVQKAPSLLKQERRGSGGSLAQAAASSKKPPSLQQRLSKHKQDNPPSLLVRDGVGRQSVEQRRALARACFEPVKGGIRAAPKALPAHAAHLAPLSPSSAGSSSSNPDCDAEGAAIIKARGEETSQQDGGLHDADFAAGKGGEAKDDSKSPGGSPRAGLEWLADLESKMGAVVAAVGDMMSPESSGPSSPTSGPPLLAGKGGARLESVDNGPGGLAKGVACKQREVEAMAPGKGAGIAEKDSRIRSSKESTPRKVLVRRSSVGDGARKSNNARRPSPTQARASNSISSRPTPATGKGPFKPGPMKSRHTKSEPELQPQRRSKQVMKEKSKPSPRLLAQREALREQRADLKAMIAQRRKAKGVESPESPQDADNGDSSPAAPQGVARRAGLEAASEVAAGENRQHLSLKDVIAQGRREARRRKSGSNDGVPVVILAGQLPVASSIDIEEGLESSGEQLTPEVHRPQLEPDEDPGCESPPPPPYETFQRPPHDMGVIELEHSHDGEGESLEESPPDPSLLGSMSTVSAMEPAIIAELHEVMASNADSDSGGEGGGFVDEVLLKVMASSISTNESGDRDADCQTAAALHDGFELHDASDMVESNRSVCSSSVSPVRTHASEEYCQMLAQMREVLEMEADNLPESDDDIESDSELSQSSSPIPIEAVSPAYRSGHLPPHSAVPDIEADVSPTKAEICPSAAERIEALRVELEKSLGLGPFLAAYRYLKQVDPEDDDDDDKVTSALEGLLGRTENLVHIPTLMQLIAAEERFDD